MRTRLIVITLALALLLVVPSQALAMTYTQARHLSASQVKTIIRTEARRAHLGTADTAALIELARRESTYHPWSRTGSCYGLFQLMKVSHNHWYDPAWNTSRAIKYIRARYSTPRRALAHSRRYGWY